MSIASRLIEAGASIEDQGEQDAAAVLYGCDTDAWNLGPNGCTQSLLHRAINERDELSACFLIRSGCDINSPRRPGPDGEGGVEAWDGMTPLHLACDAGLDVVVQTLVEHKVNVNSKECVDETQRMFACTEAITGCASALIFILSYVLCSFASVDFQGPVTSFTLAIQKRLMSAERFVFWSDVSANVNSRIQDSYPQDTAALGCQSSTLQKYILQTLAISLAVESMTAGQASSKQLYTWTAANNSAVIIKCPA
ncbi:Ankyrin repeat and FYVE domain-containing protein 1 [Desmophyllum pertusum]|uniref:Ankyrin repeat and FYVE domain-containing protein 1 n=1 Tax=Desmophyllum pertusum TaxID=174260 RepID=A0A9W9Z307_9CNID|nr:Ankyrin repeat and FYVE domain-containing protein 1 [Desmophyllum pertusum]